MQLSELIGPLKQLDVFSKLTDDQVMTIVNAAERVVFRPGQVMIEDGHAGDAAYFIVVGFVERLAQPEINRTREHFSHGILVGEMAMLVDHVHASTVRAKSEVKALKISRKMLYSVMTQNPAIADSFIQTIKGRLSVMVERIHEIDRTLEAAESGAYDTAVFVTDGAVAAYQ